MHPSYARLLQCAQEATASLPESQRIKTPSDLAKRLGMSAQTVHNWKSRGVSLEGSAAAEIAFGCTVAYIQEGIGQPSDWTRKQHLPTGSGNSLVAREMSQRGQYARSVVRAEVPVHRTVRPNAEGVLEVAQIHQTGTVTTAGVSVDAFAFRVEGDSLFPALRHGMFVVCDPAAPCVPGEWVLIETVDGALHVRELLIERELELVTASVLGGHRRTFARAEVKRAVAVTGTAFPSRFTAAA